ncbi:hypothetical protein NDU88_002657 [Pleurodeles waltl]|uniref:Uncharacterized protein n=1 Tax=Pleurodeles waltl TaxID=8319 RepID=A0AAV7TL96_PLEWA|nr:hypothetical protein NDU88_002657 [Pleurodeles waltl]
MRRSPGPTSAPGRRLGDAGKTAAAGLERCLLGSSLLMPVTSGGAPGRGDQVGALLEAAEPEGANRLSPRDAHDGGGGAKAL